VPDPEDPLDEIMRVVMSDGALPEVAVLHVDAEGKPLPGVEYTSFEEFTARGRVADCDCDLIVCACIEIRQHKEGCRYRLALSCPVEITCEAHGRDVCPTCDACTCGTVQGPSTPPSSESASPKI
jgi:hypothetical protein